MAVRVPPPAEAEGKPSVPDTVTLGKTVTLDVTLALLLCVPQALLVALPSVAVPDREEEAVPEGVDALLPLPELHALPDGEALSLQLPVPVGVAEKAAGESEALPPVPVELALCSAVMDAAALSVAVLQPLPVGVTEGLTLIEGLPLADSAALALTRPVPLPLLVVQALPVAEWQGVGVSVEAFFRDGEGVLLVLTLMESEPVAVPLGDGLRVADAQGEADLLLRLVAVAQALLVSVPAPPHCCPGLPVAVAVAQAVIVTARTLRVGVSEAQLLAERLRVELEVEEGVAELLLQLDELGVAQAVTVKELLMLTLGVRVPWLLLEGAVLRLPVPCSGGGGGACV